MNERPIIFSGPMVRALLNGTKTQTRRIAKQQMGSVELAANPYGMRGDRLWVKETWRTSAIYDNCKPSQLPKTALIDYKADELTELDRQGMSNAWRTSLFMPKQFSRIQLEIVSIRHEKLSVCSEADAIAEGVMPADGLTFVAFATTAVERYQQTWETIHGINSWTADPWVWVLEFKRLFKNPA